MHGNVKDIKGNRYGNLVVLELTDLKLPKKRGAIWKCRCDCGNICYKSSQDLRDTRRITCSCGCMNKGQRKFPNKFIPKEKLTQYQRGQRYLAKELLKHFENTKFYNELSNEINKLLEGSNKMTEYGYEVWYEGQALVQSVNADVWFESETDAEDEAQDEISNLLDEWKSDGCWSGEVEKDFDIKIIEREGFE